MIQSLKTQQEIKELFEKGRVFKFGGLKIFYRPNNLTQNRLLVSVKSTRINYRLEKVRVRGVHRNRVRRVVREWVRIQDSTFLGWDIHVLVYKSDKLISDLKGFQGTLVRLNSFK